MAAASSWSMMKRVFTQSHAGFEQRSKLVGRNRPAEIISLRLIAMASSKKGQFLARVYALGNHFELQASRHTDDGFHNSGFLRIGSDLADERLVNLQRINGKLS